MHPVGKIAVRCNAFLFALLIWSSAAHSQMEYPGPVTILGLEEVVFWWQTDSCEADNIPDTPLRLFRGAEGNIQMILGH